MTRYALFLLAALATVVHSSPLDTQVALTDDGTAHTAESWSYSNCGHDTDPIQIKSIEITPDPPKPGQEMTVKVKAQAIERVEEGASADVVVKMGVIKLLSKTFYLCEEARNADTDVQCPVEPGDYEVVQTVHLPKEIPRAKFTVNVQGYTVETKDLVCLDLKVDFTKKMPFFQRLDW